MGGAIDFLVSNSVPTSLSLMLNIGLIIAIWYHFMPAMKERQELAEQLKDKQDTQESVLEVLEGFNELKEALSSVGNASDIHEELKRYTDKEIEDRAKQTAELQAMMDRLAKEMKGNERAEHLLRDIRAEFNQRGADLHVQLQLLQSAVNEIKSTCVNISEKQSSINGALMISGADSLNKRLK